MARPFPAVGVSLAPWVRPNSAEHVAAAAKGFYFMQQVGSDSAFPTSLFYDVSARTYAFRSRRGRQYELGRAEAGEVSVTLDNSDRLFDPDYLSGALYGTLVPFRGLSVTCAYKDSTSPLGGNIVNDVNIVKHDWGRVYAPDNISYAPPFTGGGNTDYAEPVSVSTLDSNFELTNYLSFSNPTYHALMDCNWWVYRGDATYWTGHGDWSATTTAKYSFSSAQAWQGTYSLLTTVNATYNQRLCLDVPVVPGQTYTASVYVYNATWASGDQWRVYDGIYYSGATITASANLTNTAGWTRYSVTWTAVSPRATLVLAYAANSQYYIDGVQVEIGSSATAYTTTGLPVQDLFTGFVERWPQTFQAPNRGQAELVATDMMASMSQVSLNSVYVAETLQNQNLLFYYPLDSESGATAAQNQSVYNQPGLVVTPYQTASTGTVGELTFGDSGAKDVIIGAQTTGVKTTTGTAGGYYLQNTYPLQNLPLVTGASVSYTIEGWFCPDAAYTSTGDVFRLVNSSGKIVGTNLLCYWDGSTATPRLYFMAFNPDASPIFASPSTIYVTGVAAGKWHHLYCSLTYNSSSGSVTVKVSVDGAAVTTFTGTGTMVDNAYIDVAGPSTWPAQFAHFAIYRTDLVTQANALERYALGTTAWAGESITARIARLVRDSGFDYTLLALDESVSYAGPAVDWKGKNLFDLIQDAVNSEGGSWFVDGSGTVVFHSRRFRQAQQAYQYTLADTAGGVAYQGGQIVLNNDPTYILNDVTVTRLGGVTAQGYDSDSVVSYFPRTYDVTVNNFSDLEVIDLAHWLIDRYKDPVIRAESVSLTPGRNAAAFLPALGAELDDLLLVQKAQFLNGTTWDLPSFMERVEHQVDATTGQWDTVFAVSPQFKTYNEASGFQSYLNAGVSAGGTTVKTSVVAADSQNMVPNGGFENGTTYWQNSTNSALASVSTPVYNLGSDDVSYFALEQKSLAAGSMVVASQTTANAIPVKPSTQYAVSAEVFTPAAGVSRTADIRISWYNSAGTIISTVNVGSVSTVVNGWAFVTGAVTSPATAATGAILLRVQNTAAANEIHYWDNVQMQPGALAVVYYNPRQWRLSDVAPGQIFEFNPATLAGEDAVVVTAAPTIANAVLTLTVAGVKTSNTMRESTPYTVGDIGPDDTSIVLNRTDNLASPSGTVLIDLEVVTYTGITGTTLTGVSRGQSATLAARHYDGAAVFPVSGGAAGTYTTADLLSEWVLDAKTDPVTYVDDQLQSDLLTITGAATSTGSTYKYSTLPFEALPDWQNTPAGDFPVGDVWWLSPDNYVTSEYAGTVRLSQVGTAGAWTADLYPLDGFVMLSVALNDADGVRTGAGYTTVTTVTAVPAGTKAILIDDEWMEVTAGAGTTSLTVVRGTPDSAVWSPLNIGPHAVTPAGKRVWYSTTTTGLTLTYAKNSQALTPSTVLGSGFVRLAY